MYIPKHFVHDDQTDLLAVMREHSFATVIASVDGEPFATHAPVRAELGDDGVVTIEGHVASANPHARALNDGRALVIFHGPHTYVSPTLYRSAGRVPTWNYIVVHATGSARTVDDSSAKHAILARLIAEHEPTFNARFDAFEARSRDALLNAIIGFTITVDQLEGKFKLGQHRLADDRPEMQTVHESGDPDQQAIARWMKRLGFWR